MGARPDSIPYRWTAQDALGMGATPPAIKNPYGVNPAELYVATSDLPPADKRWAKDFKDGEKVDLPSRICRIPWMLDQFAVPGYIWAEVPPGIAAATLGELCTKLTAQGERY